MAVFSPFQSERAYAVMQVFEGIRDFIVQSVELKFNCFFLMPVIDQFPETLRSQLEAAWEEDLEVRYMIVGKQSVENHLAACAGHGRGVALHVKPIAPQIVRASYGCRTIAILLHVTVI